MASEAEKEPPTVGLVAKGEARAVPVAVVVEAVAVEWVG